MLGSVNSRARRAPANGVQIATSPRSRSASASSRSRRCLPTRPPLLCATMIRPGGRTRTRASAPREPVGGLDDRPPVQAQAVHDRHAMALRVERVAERSQERPVLVHAREEHDLGLVGVARAPRPREAAGAEHGELAPARRRRSRAPTSRRRSAVFICSAFSGSSGSGHRPAGRLAARVPGDELADAPAGEDHGLVPAAGHLGVAPVGQRAPPPPRPSTGARYGRARPGPRASARRSRAARVRCGARASDRRLRAYQRGPASA